jgi:alpha-glucosidase
MTQTNTGAKKKQSEESDDRQSDVINQQRPGNITEQYTDERQVIFQSENNIELRIIIHTPEIIQLKYVGEGDQPANFSYAINPGFDPDVPDFELNEKDKYYQLKTEVLLCCISKKNMQVQFYDRDKNLLCEDKKSFYRRDTLMKGVSEVKVTHKAPAGTRYFGLGDKTCTKGLRGNSFENWNTDSYSYERGDDPLYRSIPFYIALNDDGRGYGIFMDNTYRSHFDFDSKKNNTCCFSADGGCMNYYFIYGPELTTVSERYAHLTGTPELPPMWGFGYHQCRWSYFPESRVRKLGKEFRDKEIPCDAIYLDIDYMQDYRIFTWNKERFPDPSGLISDLSKQGFKTIVMIDPGIKVDNDYHVYQQGLKKN